MTFLTLSSLGGTIRMRRGSTVRACGPVFASNANGARPNVRFCNTPVLEMLQHDRLTLAQCAKAAAIKNKHTTDGITVPSME